MISLSNGSPFQPGCYYIYYTKIAHYFLIQTNIVYESVLYSFMDGDSDWQKNQPYFLVKAWLVRDH